DLVFGSPAINTGSNPDSALFDQLRGFVTPSDPSFVNPPTVNFPNNFHFRVQGPQADMGASEAPGTPPVNTPPTIAPDPIPNQSTTVDTPTAPIAITVGDAETPAGDLVVTASSSNTTLVPVANIVIGGSGANRTL